MKIDLESMNESKNEKLNTGKKPPKPSAAAVVDKEKFLLALGLRLAEAAVEISREQAAKLAEYYRLLVETNRVMNLTGIVEAAEVAEKHIADSLRLLHLLPPAAAQHGVIDVGTGAGLPGIPLAVARPEMQVILLDSQRKRCDFLTRVCNELELANVKVVWGRAEEIARRGEYRERQGCAVARAVASMPTLLEYLSPLVRRGGSVIAMKGANGAAELAAADHAMSELNLRQAAFIEYQLTDGSGRSLAVLKKTGTVKEKYPRSSGQIKKKPL